MNKKIFSLLITVLTTNVFAQDYSKVLAIQTIDKEQINRASIFSLAGDRKGRLDLLELKNGSIIYENEIETVTIEFNGEKINLPKSLIKFPASRSMELNAMPLFRHVGGDGSGGG